MSYCNCKEPRLRLSPSGIHWCEWCGRDINTEPMETKKEKVCINCGCELGRHDSFSNQCPLPAVALNEEYDYTPTTYCDKMEEGKCEKCNGFGNLYARTNSLRFPCIEVECEACCGTGFKPEPAASPERKTAEEWMKEKGVCFPEEINLQTDKGLVKLTDLLESYASDRDKRIAELEETLREIQKHCEERGFIPGANLDGIAIKCINRLNEYRKP